MKRTNLFTEEGRTRLKNFRSRCFWYLLLGLVAALITLLAIYALYLRRSLTPLQRVYLVQYIKSAYLSVTLPKQESAYRLLALDVVDPTTHSLVTVPVSDEQVIPVYRADGMLQTNSRGDPLLALDPSIKHSRYYWRQVTQNNTEMYLWFRDQRFAGRSVSRLLSVAYLPALLILMTISGALMRWDMVTNSRYLEGEAKRGTRLLKYHQWGQEKSAHDGLGLVVCSPFRRQP